MAKSAPAEINVEVLVRASVYVPVRAKTLEDAMAHGRSLKWSDVAEFDGEVMDANIEVIGAWDPNGSRKLDA